MAEPPAWNDDFVDLVKAMLASKVEFLIVGAHAMALHGVPRATGDLDVWVRPTPDNAARVYAALTQFGAPLEAHGVSARDFEVPGTVYQMGLPPRRIDLLTQISGVGFEEAWQTRKESALHGLQVACLGREALLKNKLASGRPKDLLDVEILRGPAHE